MQTDAGNNTFHSTSSNADPASSQQESFGETCLGFIAVIWIGAELLAACVVVSHYGDVLIERFIDLIGRV